MTFFIDAEGRHTDDASNAVAGEIHKPDGTRVYYDLRPEMPEEHDDPAPFAAMVSVDEAAGLDNADAIKLSWDVRGPDQEPVETVAGLVTALGLDASTDASLRTALCGLLELPSWGAAPQVLKDEAYAFLVATRGE